MKRGGFKKSLTMVSLDKYKNQQEAGALQNKFTRLVDILEKYESFTKM